MVKKTVSLAELNSSASHSALGIYVIAIKLDCWIRADWYRKWFWHAVSTNSLRVWNHLYRSLYTKKIETGSMKAIEKKRWFDSIGLKNISFLSQYQCQSSWILIQFCVWTKFGLYNGCLKMQKRCSLTQMIVNACCRIKQILTEKKQSLLLLNIPVI